MKTFSKALIMGHLAADPEIRKTKTGKSVANFPLATNSDIKKKNGEVESKVDFHRIIAWEKLGEICEKYLKKGSAVLIGGRISNRSYDSKEGEKKYVTEIIADDINILSWKNKEEAKQL